MNSRIAFLVFLVFSVLSNRVSGQTPETPVLQYVTVDSLTQQVHLGWSVNDQSQLDGYIILRQIFNQSGVVDGTFNYIDTIYNPNQFDYIDNGSNYGVASPGLKSEVYKIRSFQIVGVNMVSSTLSNTISTMYLYPVNFNPCLEQNSLIWTSYKGFSGQGTYKIYYSDSPIGTSPTLLSEQAMPDTTYIHTHVDANRQYYYFIEAFSLTGFPSLSNIQTITTSMPAVPSLMNADYASVAFHNQVELLFTVDASAQVNSYKLLKSKSLNGPWDTIASFPMGLSQINTIDNINTSSEVYYYKVVAINNCHIESRNSNIAHNIVLEAWLDEKIKYTNQLKWNPYETWLGGVDRYRVFRSIDGTAFEEIGQLSPTELTFTDDVAQFVVSQSNNEQSKGQFCYYVEAIEGNSNPYGINGTSKSNISCVQQEAIVFVPNAFNPKSATDDNRTFRPMMSFVNDYSLIIYNRWGEIIFKTSDPLNGWDGTYKGELQPKATYVYYLKYRTKDNKKVEKSGQVNLVY